MKSTLSLYSRLLAMLIALACSATMLADDYPALKMGEVFSIKNFGEDVWTITPTETGIMKIVGDNGDGDWIGSCLVVYADAGMTNEVHSYNYTCYEVNAEAGHTYYIKNWNWTGQDYKGHCTMSAAFAYSGAQPADGAKFAVTSNNVAQLNFTSTNVTFTKGEVTANGHTVKVYNFTDYNALVASGIFTYTQEGTSGVVNWNGCICGRTDRGIVVDFTSATGHGYFNVINRLYDEGKLAAGDPIKLTLHGVKNLLTGELLDGTGELEVNWTFAGAPTTLKASHVPETILSWYNPGDEAAVATFTFSRGIGRARASLEMGQGEGADDLYEEEIDPSKITFDGPTVKVDLSGVMRTQTTMNLKMKWNSFTLKLYGVVDVEGNDAFSEDLGSASSYTFTTGYKDISSTLSSEILPASGSVLTAADKEVEIWFNNTDLIEYDGVSITYYTTETVEEVDFLGNPVQTEQNVAHETFVPNAQLRIDSNADGTTIVCPLPEGTHEAQNVSVKLHITKTADGNAHDIVAYYNATIAYELNIQQIAEPVNESTVHRLSEIYLPLGFTYAINTKLTNGVTVTSKTDRQLDCTAQIVNDGKVQAKIVLDNPITEAGSYTITIAQGAIGDYVFGESGFKSGTANLEAILNYTVTGLWSGRDVVATPDNDETVASLSEIKLTFFNYSSVAPTWDTEKAPYVEEVADNPDAEAKRYEGAFVPEAGDANEVVFVLDKPLATPGQYRFVLTAGSVANGATGDPINTEYTFNYTIAEAAPATKPALDPAEGTYDEIGNILIDFGQPVTLVKESPDNDWWVPQPMLSSTDGGWTFMASGKLTTTDNPNVVMWEQDGTAVKGCDVGFSIPAGCVRFADGTTNADFTYSYTITGANAVELNILATFPEQWTSVDELTEMTITFDRPVTVGDFASVVVRDAFWAKEANGTITPGDDASTVKLVFAEPVRDFGEASITISAFSLAVGEGKFYDQDLYLNLTIGETGNGGGGNGDPADNERIELTPAPNSEVASLKYFEITFGGYLGAWNEKPITLSDQFDNVITSVGPYSLSGTNAEGVSFWEIGKGTNTYSITLPEEISKPGFYVLTIPAVCEKADGNTVNREFFYMFEVVESIPDNIAVATSAGIDTDVYTISGTLVKKAATPADINALPAGLYIIGNRKVHIKK